MRTTTEYKQKQKSNIAKKLHKNDSTKEPQAQRKTELCGDIKGMTS